MIKLFSQLCKCFKEIYSKNEIIIFNEYMRTLDVDSLICPGCGAKHALSPFASYERHLVTYYNNEAVDNIINISRYICSSCGHTHAILPSVIIPYMSFSFNFTISIIHDYLVHKFNSVESLCHHYGIAISTFYRILKRFKEHKKLWLGLLADNLVSALSFVQHIINSTFFEVETFSRSFLNRTGSVFLGETS